MSLEELTPSSHSSYNLERSNLQVQTLRNQKAPQDVERIAAKLAQAGNLSSHNSKKQTNSLKNLISISNKKRLISPKLDGIKSKEIYANQGHRQQHMHLAAQVRSLQKETAQKVQKKVDLLPGQK